MVRYFLIPVCALLLAGCATMGQGTLEEQQNAVKQQEALDSLQPVMTYILGFIK